MCASLAPHSEAFSKCGKGHDTSLRSGPGVALGADVLGDSLNLKDNVVRPCDALRSAELRYACAGLRV